MDEGTEAGTEGRAPDKRETDDRGHKTMHKLLDAAEEIFGRNGYHNASIVEITRAAGVAQGTFYVHFPSKIEVFRLLIRTRMAQLNDARAAAVAAAAPGAGTTEANYRAYFDWISEHPGLYRVLRQVDYVDPDLNGLLFEAARETVSSVRARIDAGLIPETDAEVLAWCLMGMADFTALRWIVEGGGVPLSADRFEAFLEILSRLLGVRTAPPGEPDALEA